MEDKRITKSKKFLKEALLSLLETTSLANITVSALCLKAEINRVTFYAHYKSVENLFDEIEADFMDNILKSINSLFMDNETRKKALVSLIDFIDDNSKMFVLIFEKSNHLDYHIQSYQALNKELQKKIKSDISIYLANYLIYSGGSILYTWIKNNKKESKEEIGSLLNNLTMNGLNSIK